MEAGLLSTCSLHNPGSSLLMLTSVCRVGAALVAAITVNRKAHGVIADR
jgi:hypothetical protein